MKLKANVQFKPLTAHQAVLFPQSLDDRIAKDHAVRIVNSVVDKLNIDDILESYKGGGTSSFHPRMMLKVLFYSYFNNIYSCRKIAKALEENIHFMWLSGNSNPDYRTINEFRGKRLKDKIQTLFSELVKLMQELGYVSLETQFVDGTKLESVANRYTFVWKKSIEKNKEKLEKKVQSILGDIDKTIESDKVESSSENTVKQVNKEELDQKIAELNTRMDELSKSEKKQVKELSKHAQKLGEYQQHLDKMEDRNSYSKTDPDATFMRMKEDHMGNGQLKPAYNLQISTENQVVTNFSIHQRPNDTGTLKSHLEQFKNFFGKQSKTVVADAGYGSEENYTYLEVENIEPYVKYNQFYQEQKGNKKNPFQAANLFYNAEGDFYVCPMGQRMEKIRTAKTKSERGFESEATIYQAIRCEGCPLRGICHDSKENRQIKVNHNLNRLRAKARDLLLSEQGIQYRKLRCIEPESVFGQLKSNNSFNRMKMRGIPKVEIDLGLAIIGHNLRKIVAKKTTSKTDSLKTQLKTVLITFLNPIRAFIANFYKLQTNLLVFQPKSSLNLARF
jgi:transposase